MEDAGIKLSTVASDISGVSGRLMLQALIDGHPDPAALADLAKRRLRHKIPELTEALTGPFSEHHACLAGIFLETIDQRTRQVEQLNQRIDQAMAPFRSFSDLICSIPRHGPPNRRSHRRRNRRRHDRVPKRQTPRLSGRGLPGQQRIRRPGQVHQDPPRKPLPESRTRHRRTIDRGHPRKRLLPTPRPPNEPDETPPDNSNGSAGPSHSPRRAHSLTPDTRGIFASEPQSGAPERGLTAVSSVFPLLTQASWNKYSQGATGRLIDLLGLPPDVAWATLFFSVPMSPR